MARRLGLPRSSYSSIETGAYQMRVDFLYQALDLLGVDIVEVWPFPDQMAESGQTTRSRLYQIHQFRLREIVSISQAKSGLLLSHSGDKVRVNMSCHVDEVQLERITHYAAENHCPEGYSYFTRRQGQTRFVLFLEVERLPKYLRLLIEHYLAVWSSFFAGHR